MKVLDMAFRFAMPVLVFLTMAIGFALGHELAVLLLDPTPWSFIYNVISGLCGTVALSVLLVKLSRVYFTKQFQATVDSLGITPNYVFEEAGNGIAIDVDQGKVAMVEQGTSFCTKLSSVTQIESGWDQKSRLNRKVANNTLHIYTKSKENSLVTISYGMNASKRNQALRQLDAAVATSTDERSDS